MICFIGDVHGRFKKLAEQLASLEISDSVFVQVGDFGAGFKTKDDEHGQLGMVNDSLSQHNNKLYVVRGNRDDPSYFSATNWIGDICFLGDYSLLKVENKNMLLAGGAISIDRTHRVVGSSYWREEIFEYDREKLDNVLKNIDKLDIVVTHNAPKEFWPDHIGKLVYEFTDKDKNLPEDIMEEREEHGRLLAHLKQLGQLPGHWYYGHYHKPRVGEHERIVYRVIGTMEIFIHR